MTMHALFQGHLLSQMPVYLDILHQMVDINSFTANAQGVNQLAHLTAEVFARLGFQADFVRSENPKLGNHLFLTRQPSIHSQEMMKKSVPALALISHLDTVYSPEEERQNNFTWRVEGERIYGPGAVDIKGGTILMYMMLDALKEIDPFTYDAITWKVFMDASEETLSDDFGKLVLERIPENTLACLVFEGGTPAEGKLPIVVARKGRATFKIKAFGKSAHAGNDHAHGANALLQLAYTIQKIESLTNYAEKLTFNVGFARGGSVVNRVPHYAEASVEMRAFDPEVFQRGKESLLALDGSTDVVNSDGFACKVAVETLHQTDPWPRNPATERLYNLWKDTANLLGLQVIPEERGGLSDGNYLWQQVPTLDGLGPTGANAHCSERSLDGTKDQEYVEIPSFMPKALLNIMAVRRLILDNPAL